MSTKIVNEVHVGKRENVVLFRIIGKGDFQNAHGIKQYCRKLFEQEAVDIIFDLKQCIGMDSTFMGMLMGVNVMIQQRSENRRITLINVCGKNIYQLQMLGLSHILDIEYDESSNESNDIATNPIHMIAESRFDMKRTMLDAHRELAKIKHENKQEFRDIIAFLENDLKKMHPDNPSGL